MTTVSTVSEPIASSSKGTIAIDMDDVLCQTNETIVGMHNKTFGVQPPLTLDDFQNYLYWKNRGWGTPAETVSMVTNLYHQGLCTITPPVPGAKDALLRLKDMGYNLIIITARSESQREMSEDWIAKYLPDIFDEIHFTGAFLYLAPTTEETEGHVAKKAVVSHVKRSKAEIVHSTSSLFLIDDSADNAYEAVNASPPCKVLLFGSYPWNAIVRNPHDTIDLDGLSYGEKEQRGLLEESAARRKELMEKGWLPDGVERVKDWEAVMEWVKAFEKRR